MVHPPPNRKDAPAVTEVEITEPTAVNAGIEFYDLDAVQLQSAPLRARRVIVRLDVVTVVYHSTNLRIRTRTTIDPGLVAYVAFGPQTHGTVNGLPVRSGMMLSVNSSTECIFVAEAGYESLAFLVSEKEFREHLAARHRDVDFHMPQSIEPLKVPPEAVSALFDWGKRLVDLAARQPSLFNDGERERKAVEVELLETLLATLDDSEAFETTREDRTRQAHGLIVRKAEDYVLSRAGEHVSLSDLCRVTAASERTLQSAFQEVVGLTPLAFLTRVRLHKVREALLAESHGTATVSEVALRWGFWHFGDFSRAYKSCFGELPSDTLRRAPGER